MANSGPGDGVNKGKIVIAGTGRAGTTLLMAILSDLGLDTGYRPGVPFNGVSGGLETDLEARRDTPRIVKSPSLSTRLGRLLDEESIQVEHVIIPIRDLKVAAASRVRVAGYGRFLGVPGGFLGTRSASRQQDVLAGMLAELMWTIARFDLPHTFLDFPRFAYDWEYTHAKLGFLVPELEACDFKRVLEARYDAGEIRQEPLTPYERVESAVIQPWTIARRTAERARRRDGEFDFSSIHERNRSLPESVRTYATKPTMPLRRLLSRSRMWRLWRGRDLRRRAPGPLVDVQNEWSVIAAPSPREAGPSPELVNLVLRAARYSQEAELSMLRQRHAAFRRRPERVPGQHYRVLAGLTRAWNARRIVEIGTYEGSSSLAMLEIPSVEHLITYDLIPWDQFPKTALRSDDFGDRFEQRIRNLGEPDVFAAESDELARADMIFIDASKDGVFEPTFLTALFATEPNGPQLIVLDDIRVLTMIRVWREIPYDKFDLTSFGNWSGTGVVVRGGVPSDLPT